MIKTNEIKNKAFDCIVVGAGFAGAVCARELADQGQQVLVIEQRNHTGGNAYDHYNKEGLLVHKYGPHIFHTKMKHVYDYLSKFTSWINYEHKVVASVHQQLIPVPFNKTALEQVYGIENTTKIIKTLQTICIDQISILDMLKCDDTSVRAVANYVYENIFKFYTMKQWGLKPEDLDPSVAARVPVRLSYDPRYFTDAYQGMPSQGYHQLFKNMLNHDNIHVKLNCKAKDLLTFTNNNQILFKGKPYFNQVIYTGPLDQLFDHRFGPLPYRTLDFKFETYEKEYYQAFGTVNYTVDQSYTRITEFKHLTGQVCNKTTIVKEYPLAYTDELTQIPYYPIISDDNLSKYEQYRHLSDCYSNLHLIGRLANYKYYNMDIIVDESLKLIESITKSEEAI